MFAELHAATSSRRERLDEAAGTTPEEPEEEQPPVQGEPLTVRERFAFSTFEKVWTKRMGVLDDEEPVTVQRLLFDPPSTLSAAMVRSAAPRLVRLISAAARWQRLPSSLSGSSLQVLPEPVVSPEAALRNRHDRDHGG